MGVITIKQELDFEVIASGSSGNSVKIENVMIDIGIPFKRLKPYLYDIDVILITHSHSDHLNLTSYKKIKQLFPHITIVGNYQVGQRVDLDIICNAGYSFTVGEVDFIPVELIHDVLCYGFIWEEKGNRVLYATDTSTLSMIDRQERFDYMFIESNHDETVIKQVKKSHYGYDVVAGAERHLSTQQSKEFYYVHRVDKDSKWVELHKSSRFY